MRLVQKKVCLLGDFAVGKTSLIRRFVEGRFDDKYLSTIGVKISRKSLDRGTHTLNLIIWDLAGGEDFGKATSGYLRGAAGALLVCDLTRPETLDALRPYVTQLRAHNRDAKLVFVGNKADLVDERAIDDDALRAVGTSEGGPIIITSAKTGAQVEQAFQLLADQFEVGT